MSGEPMYLALRRALESAHPNAMRRLLREMQMFDSTASGVGVSAQPFYRKVRFIVDTVVDVNLKMERDAEAGPRSVTVTARTAHE